METNLIIDLILYDKIKFLLYSVFFGLVTCCKNLFFSLWKKPVESDHPDKPMPCLVSSKLGNHSYVKVNGVKLHYVECGERHKQLVLLLHGFPDCWLSWRNQIKSLSQHFRVVAIDLKGFGDSEKPEWRHRYQVRVLMQELQELIYALDEKNCFLVGHDIGAMLGWYFAAINPKMVSKFIAIACPHPNVHWEYLPNADGFNLRFLHLCQLPYLPEIEIRRNDFEIIRKMHRHLVKKGSKEFLNAYKYVFSRAQDRTGPVNYLRSLPLTRLKPKKISVPTLLIVGNRDPFIAVESIVRSTAFLEDYQLRMVEEAGHFPHQENPDEVNRLITSFFIDVPVVEQNETKTDGQRGLIGSLVTNTFRYGNTLVDNVKKTTNGVVDWRPQILKSSG